MRDQFPGFYRPGEEDVDELWQKALIVPDANVLLTIYRLAEGTRGKLLAIFESLGERLFLPHQVALEFQRNRLDVIRDQEQAYDRIEAQVRAFAAKVGGSMGRHPKLDKDEIEREISEALKPVEEHLDRIRAEHPDPLTDGDMLGTDSVRDEIDRVFADKLGSARDVKELTRLGRERFAKRLPPGYEDGGKDEPERYGDLALWLEMLDRAKGESRGVIFVTEERKADWWWKRGNEMLAPRPELIEEMRREAEQRFWIYSLNRFMDLASEKLDIAISDDERDDVARAGNLVETAAVAADIGALLGGQESSGAEFPLGAIPTNVIGAELSHLLANASGGPAGFNASPAFGLFNWHTSVSADDGGVVLAISWKDSRKPVGIGLSLATLTCEVVAPSKRTYSTSRQTITRSVHVSYPADFGNPEPETGTHTVVWFYEEFGEEQSTPVAYASFELG